MDEKVAQLIEALTETVRAMDERSVRDQADNPANLRDAFRKTDAQVTKDSNKDLAELNAEENSKARQKEEEAKGRRIMKNVMPINVMSFDQKALKQLAGISPTVKEAKDKVEKPEEEKDSAFMSLLKGLAYTAFAAIVGPVMILFGFFEEINKQKWFIKLKEFLKRKFWEPIKKFFRPVVKFFTRVKNSKFIKTITQYVDDAWKGIKSFGRRVRTFIKPVTDFITRMKNSKFITTLTSMFTRVSSFMGGSAGKPSVFGKILNFFNPAKNKVLSGIMRFARGIGATLGKLFLPLTIIMGVIDGVKGFMKGYEEEGDLFGGITGAIEGIINGLIMLPLDLLKDGLSWVLDAVGLEGASDWLDSFSFQEMFGQLSDVLFGNIRKAWSNLTKNFTDLWDSFFGEGEGIDWKKAFGAVLKIFYTIPVYLADLVKDGISMVLGWFGVDTTWLDSFDIMDIFNETVDWFMGVLGGIVDWFKLLFTEPSKAFKKIGDWFDRLFDDPVGTIKDMLPEWMFNVGKWIWDHTLGPIVDLWNSILGNPEGAKQAFLNLMPEWLRGIAEWIWDRTIGPAVDLWNFVFDHPEGVKGAIKALMPEWLWDIGAWIWDNTIGPPIKAISEFFSKLFDGDIIGAFKAILPDWLLDFFGWLSDSIFGPVGQWFSDQWGAITDMGRVIKQKLKENYPAVYDFWYGEEEELAAQEKAEAAKQAEQLQKQGMSADAAKLVAEARLESRQSRGGDTVGDATEDYGDRLESMIADNKQLSDDHFNSILKGFQSGGFGIQQSKLGQEVLALTGGSFDATNKKHQEVLKAQLKKIKADETFGDDINDDYDESLSQLAAASGQYEMGQGVHDDTVDATVKALQKVGFLKLGSDHFLLDGSSPVTPSMVSALQTMFDKGSDDTKVMVDALKKLNITPTVLSERVTVQPADSDQQLSEEMNKQASLLQNAQNNRLSDFIMRPGMDPVAFDKGDILLGVHRDNPPAATVATDSPELINRVDMMVNTLTENKDIQAKMLEALVESGIMDKQGNTVVNNGGNSTVVNNNTVESNIMSFRDRVSGRLNDGTTKY